VVDLFCGCGGLSVGVGDAIAAIGHTARFAGFDTDESALQVYARNLPGSTTHAQDLSIQLDGAIGKRATANEKDFLRAAPRCDVLVAGPPCQGHSAANNRTRHRDSRNQLLMTTVRAAELMEPEHLIVENVPGALNDRSGVVYRAIAELERIGYRVSTEVVDASELGVPQRRRRLLLLATKSLSSELDGIGRPTAKEARTVRWAFADLQDVSASSVFDEPARSAPQTMDRIDTLFDQDLYELPDEYRPPCHANGGHSYVSIYGRLRWDEPAQTLTTGFYSMCMGRYVHPSRRRTITAHEAARIQGLPDWFSFGDLTKRVDLSRMIGNAVPPRLGYAAGLELFR
jgi:DNA (cytosine-5)-methyltransferase 1